ncbi:MAG: hydrolase [Clostridia bacterium]|nr:hydrolase [Clostridia bacterium]
MGFTPEPHRYGDKMSYIPSPEEALEIVKRYNKEDFHIQHAITVGDVMAKFAEKYDADNVDYWKAVGIMHDLDFELYPDQHCVKTQQMMREMDIDEDFIRSVASHGWGICVDIKPEKQMEKVLFAVDELTGLIGAAALMRPTGMEGMEVKSIVKKFKDKRFAAGCSRDIIKQGAEMLGMELNELIGMTIEAMK